jgi:hypothetical protein
MRTNKDTFVFIAIVLMIAVVALAPFMYGKRRLESFSTVKEVKYLAKKYNMCKNPKAEIINGNKENVKLICDKYIYLFKCEESGWEYKCDVVEKFKRCKNKLCH